MLTAPPPSTPSPADSQQVDRARTLPATPASAPATVLPPLHHVASSCPERRRRSRHATGYELIEEAGAARREAACSKRPSCSTMPTCSTRSRAHISAPHRRRRLRKAYRKRPGLPSLPESWCPPRGVAVALFLQSDSFGPGATAARIESIATLEQPPSNQRSSTPTPAAIAAPKADKKAKGHTASQAGCRQSQSKAPRASAKRAKRADAAHHDQQPGKAPAKK